MQAMSSARREKLRKIQEREAAKARLSRLQTMLEQKLVLKYGSKRNLNSKLNQEIKEEVSSFTARISRQPTDGEFLALENAVRELRAKYRNNGGSHSPTGSRGSDYGGRRSSAACGGSNGTRGSSKRVDQGNNGGGGENGSGGGGGDGECQGLPPSIARAWRTFDVAKQIEYETKEKQKAEKAKLQKIIFQQELETLRVEQAKKKAAEENEKRQHMEEQEKRLADFHREQEEIKKRAADKHAEEKALRQQQVERLKAEKERERQARLEKERHDIALCKAQLQGEAAEVERRRKNERDRLAAIQAENARVREIRAQRQRESDEADALLLKEQRRRMDAEEQARAAKLQQRMKRYEAIGDFWSKQRVGHTEDVVQREAQQMLNAARRKEQAILERERKEREARREASMAMAAENQKRIHEKKALSAKKHNEDMEFAQRFISDSEAFRQEEREKIAMKKIAMAKYRKDLEMQVEETKARRNEEMNDTEYRMNSDLVKRLEADNKLVAQVRQRMENAR